MAQIHTKPRPVSLSGRELLTANEVAAWLTISIRELYRMVARGELAAPVRIARRTVRWLPSDVEAVFEAIQIARSEESRPMLVTSRKVGEGVVINTPAGPVKVTVLSVKGSSSGEYVRLGIDAPVSCNIRRAELPAILPGATPGAD